MSLAWLRFYIRGEVGAEEAGGNEGISRCAPCESFFFSRRGWTRRTRDGSRVIGLGRRHFLGLGNGWRRSGPSLSAVLRWFHVCGWAQKREIMMIVLWLRNAFQITRTRLLRLGGLTNKFY